MNYDEAKIEEVENLISKVKCAVAHTNTTLVTTTKGNHPRVEMTAEMYVDETDDVIIDKTGKKIEKFRVVEYLNKEGGRTKNPDYDPNRIFNLDIPGYLKS